MAKQFNFGAYDRKHLANIAKRLKAISSAYEKAVKKGCTLAESTSFADPEGEFKFRDYPQIKKQLDDILNDLRQNLGIVIKDGDREAWLLSSEKNDDLVKEITKGISLPTKLLAQFNNQNMAALAAFQGRKVAGMGLSKRVWNLTDQFKGELELALELGLGDGKSAAELTHNVQQYLREPNRLFHRVRDEKGVLRLSEAAKAYHPGQGVYRSSYKNAMRLTATENNMAYRTADHLRWQQLDFVLGIEIKLSNNHTLNGKEFKDICDELNGTYPKDFKFVGWHPFCRCFAVPKLATPEQVAEQARRMADGEDDSGFKYPGTEDSFPKNFTDWVKDNSSRIVRARKIPYFLKDNIGMVDKIYHDAYPNTRISSNIGHDHFYEYLEKMRWENGTIRAIYDQLDDQGYNDLGTAMLVNQAKQECAQITYNNLIKWGIIDESWLWSANKFNFELSKEETMYSHGKAIKIKAKVMDLMEFKSPNGCRFILPVGIDEVKAQKSFLKDANEMMSSIPYFLRKGVKSVKFVNTPNPFDPFWKIEYSNPNHVSLASDGGEVTWYQFPKTPKEFKRTMCHEAAHVLDKNEKYSKSVKWLEAVKKDEAISHKYGLEGTRVTQYAETNEVENFAECMDYFLNNRERLKLYWPNCERFLHNLSIRLNRLNQKGQQSR